MYYRANDDGNFDISAYIGEPPWQHRELVWKSRRPRQGNEVTGLPMNFADGHPDMALLPPTQVTIDNIYAKYMAAVDAVARMVLLSKPRHRHKVWRRRFFRRRARIIERELNFVKPKYLHPGNATIKFTDESIDRREWSIYVGRPVAAHPLGDLMGTSALVPASGRDCLDTGVLASASGVTHNMYLL